MKSYNQFISEATAMLEEGWEEIQKGQRKYQAHIKTALQKHYPDHHVEVHDDPNTGNKFSVSDPEGRHVANGHHKAYYDESGKKAKHVASLSHLRPHKRIPNQNERHTGTSGISHHSSVSNAIGAAHKDLHDQA